MKKYPQHSVNVTATQEQKIALFTDEEIRTRIKDGENRLKGRGRIVVRPSGTEPLIRIMAEGEDPTETKAVAESIASSVKKRLEGY